MRRVLSKDSPFVSRCLAAFGRGSALHGPAALLAEPRAKGHLQALLDAEGFRESLFARFCADLRASLRRRFLDADSPFSVVLQLLASLFSPQNARDRLLEFLASRESLGSSPGVPSLVSSVFCCKSLFRAKAAEFRGSPVPEAGAGDFSAKTLRATALASHLLNSFFFGAPEFERISESLVFSGKVEKEIANAGRAAFFQLPPQPLFRTEFALVSHFLALESLCGVYAVLRLVQDEQNDAARDAPLDVGRRLLEGLEDFSPDFLRGYAEPAPVCAQTGFADLVFAHTCEGRLRGKDVWYKWLYFLDCPRAILEALAETFAAKAREAKQPNLLARVFVRRLEVLEQVAREEFVGAHHAKFSARAHALRQTTALLDTVLAEAEPRGKAKKLELLRQRLSIFKFE